MNRWPNGETEKQGQVFSVCIDLPHLLA